MPITATLPIVADELSPAACRWELRGLPRVSSLLLPRVASPPGCLVETIAKVGFDTGAEEARDILGLTYEYFIKEFAHAEGHRGWPLRTAAA
jgi:hypothetical protein